MSLQIEPEKDAWKVICQKCQHFERVDKATAEKYDNDPESFHCELCYVAPGDPKPLTRKFNHCATCQQSYLSGGSCECPIKASTISITYDPKNVWWKHNRVDEKKEMASAQREFNHIVVNKRVEQEDRNKHVEELLIENNKLLKKFLEKNVQEK